MKKYKNFFKKYKQAWTLLYVFIYFPWFFYLEKTVTTNYYLIHCELDDKIPFCEYFIIPYLFWFVYIGGTVAWFLFKEPKHSFYQLTGVLFSGMTICLLICTIFPNGLNIRPDINFEKNLFTRLTSIIYTADTSTNVFPSIHVFTSVAVVGAIKRSSLAKKHKWITPASKICSLLIVLSTLFLKQHSIVDVGAGFLLGITMCECAYIRETKKELLPVFSGGHK